VKVVDTNVLVRLITKDLVELAGQAQEMIEQAQTGEIAVGEAVIEELCFVLEFHESYKMPRAVVYRAITTLLADQAFSITRDIHRALDLYGKHSELDYVDCLIAVRADMKRKNVLTFDKDLQKVLS
jgi:predicted nucleic-acid-binding protein